jgi:predicted nuclease of predicted toxin-antitoxin system
VARLFADEDVSLWTVYALRRLGHDVLTTREAGLANQGISDRVILEVAITDGRVVLTRNRRDFVRLHRQRVHHAGIIVCTAADNFERQAQRIHAAISGLDDLASRLIRVTRPGPAEERA